MQKKLLELLSQIQDCGCDVTDVVQMIWVENTDVVNHLILNKVAVLPCDIGDILYRPNLSPFKRAEEKDVLEHRVSGIQKKADGTWKIRLTAPSGGVYDIRADEIGKVVFRSYEEADSEYQEHKGVGR